MSLWQVPGPQQVGGGCLPPQSTAPTQINYKMCGVQWNTNENAGPLVQKLLRISRRWWQSIKLSMGPCANAWVASPWSWPWKAPCIFSSSSPHPTLSPSYHTRMWRQGLGSSWHTWETQEEFGTKRVKAHLGSGVYQLVKRLPWNSLAISLSLPPSLLGSLCQRQPSGFSGWWYKHQTRSWELTIASLDHWRHFMPSLVSVSLPIKLNG